MKITEVSKKYNISQDTLRYYERIGLLPKVTRNKSGIRDFSEEDCRWVEFIKCMRSAGLSIEVLIEYVGLFQQGDSTVSARKELLVEQRKILIDKMEDLKNTIDRLDGKIDKYEKTVALCENELKRRD